MYWNVSGVEYVTFVSFTVSFDFIVLQRTVEAREQLLPKGLKMCFLNLWALNAGVS